MSLAENHVISNQLKEVVVGKRIVKVITNQNPHTFVWFAMEPSQAFSSLENSNQYAQGYEGYLLNQIVEKSDVKGGYNYLYIGDRALIFNIPTYYHKHDEKLPKKHQLLLTFDDGSALSFTGSLGGPLFLFQVDENGNAINWSSSFPSVLSDDFSEEFFMNLIDNTEFRSLSAKAFLATKGRIPGLDNSILQEILWEAKVNPKSKMVNLTNDDFNKMYKAIKKVFPTVIEYGGKDTEKDLFGNKGRYITKVSKNTLGLPCERCGEPIIKEAYLGGSVYYCPKCQPL
jgi:formamidopyrimidine-DNA glycosylase